MDPRSSLEKGPGPEMPLADAMQHGWPGTSASDPPPGQGEIRFPGEDGGKSLAEMAQRDLAATLQLLAERAQYITGATGAAIALRDHEQMVCRASAGISAPEVGAQLQVNSGLSGESVRTRQTLRCDDAATDPRVNRESCEALGIASVVVMPLLQGDDVIGVFELFSDKANVFEARDITALERMGTMVFTALEHVVAAQGLTDGAQRVATRATASETAAVVAPTVDQFSSPSGAATQTVPPDFEPSNELEARAAAELSNTGSGITFHSKVPAFPNNAPKVAIAAPLWEEESDDILGDVAQAQNADLPIERAPVVGDARTLDSTRMEEMTPSEMAAFVAARVDGLAAPEAAVREGQVPAEREPASMEEPSSLKPFNSPVAGLRKCEACGFPVSEGRQLCLDCERKKQPAGETHATGWAHRAPAASQAGVVQDSRSPATGASISSSVASDGPRFLAHEQQESSWLASHKYMVGAIAVALVGIVVLLLAR